jgi:hypothetical protein
MRFDLRVDQLPPQFLQASECSLLVEADEPGYSRQY